MNNKVSRNKRKVESLEEEMERLDEEITGKRIAQTFPEYQRAVAEITSPWPNENKNEAFKNIASLALQAVNSAATEQKMSHAASILRLLAEICDTIPVSLERLAQISLSQKQTLNNTQYFLESRRREYLPLDDAKLRLPKADGLAE